MKNQLFYIFLLLHLPFVYLSAEEGGSPDGSQLQLTANKGQWDSRIWYRAELNHGKMLVEKDKLHFMLIAPEHLELIEEVKHGHVAKEDVSALDYHFFNIEFVGAAAAESEGAAAYDSYRNYYLGSKPSRWATHVPVYRQTRLLNLYEGVDMDVYSKNGHIKYDFIVAPNADADQILLRFNGLDGLMLKNGELHLQTSIETLIQKSPYSYQIVNGVQQKVACEYIFSNGAIGFSFPDGYNSSLPLIIDPEIVFATLTGAAADNWGSTATYDVDGNFYGGGIGFDPFSYGVNDGYPTTIGAFSQEYGGGDPFFNISGTDITITKYTPDGTDLVYSTYLGGAGSEFPHSLIVNSNNELIVLGTTASENFPLPSNAYDATFNGGISSDLNNVGYDTGSDIVVAKFSADGGALTGGTYLGGSHNDGFNEALQLNYNYGDIARGEVVLDANDNIVIVSSTLSDDFPASNNAYQSTLQGGQDGIVAKFSADLSTLQWATYLGGSDADGAYSAKIDEAGNVYVGGGTSSSDFPVIDGFDEVQNGNVDGFVAHISNDGGAVLNSTFLGTTQFDQVYFVELDNAGFVYVYGISRGNYPVSEGVYSNANGRQFIQKLGSQLNNSVFSTVFGAGTNTNSNISPSAFLVDKCGKIYISGWGGAVNSTGGNTQGLPITPDAYQSNTDGSDFYFMVLEPNAASLNYATFFGSPMAAEHVDGGTSRFDKEGVIYQAVCAACGGNNFPTTPGVWSPENGSPNCNMGAIKFAFEPNLVTADFIVPETGCAPETLTFENTSTEAVGYFWDFGNGITSTDTNPTVTYEAEGTYLVTLIASNPDACNLNDTITKTVTLIGGNADAYFSDGNFCYGDDVYTAFTPNTPGGTWSSEGINIDPVTGYFTIDGLEPGNYYVTYTVGQGDCATSFTQKVKIFPLPDPAFTTSMNVYCSNDTEIGISAVSLGGQYNVSVNGQPYYNTQENSVVISGMPLNQYANTITIEHIVFGDFACVQYATQNVTVYNAPEIYVGIGDCIDDGSGNIPVTFNLSGFTTQSTGTITVMNNSGIFVQLSAANPSATINMLGDGMVHTVTVSDSESGCLSQFTFGLPYCDPCDTEAGTMPASIQYICDGGTVQSAVIVGTPVLEEDDALMYIIHSTADASAGTIFASNSTGVFTASDVPSRNTIYYISAVAGNAIGNGMVDLNDNCTQIAAGTPVVFLEPIVIYHSIECLNDLGEFQVFAGITGGLPEYLWWQSQDSYYIIEGDYNDDASISYAEQFLVNTFPDGSTYTIAVSDQAGCAADNVAQEIVACYKLAVDLLYFEGTVRSDANVLSWASATESGKNEYILTRSFDGVAFKEIARINGTENSNATQHYTFEDKDLKKGTIYYQLLIRDESGQETASRIVTLYRQPETFQLLSVSPVPVNDVLTVVLESVADETVRIQVSNIEGKILSIQQAEAHSGENTFTLDMSQLSAGVYWLEVGDAQQTLHQRFIKR